MYLVSNINVTFVQNIDSSKAVIMPVFGCSFLCRQVQVSKIHCIQRQGFLCLLAEHTQMTQSCHEAGRRKDAPGSEALILFLLFLLLKDTLNLGFFQSSKQETQEQKANSCDNSVKTQIPFLLCKLGSFCSSKMFLSVPYL